MVNFGAHIHVSKHNKHVMLLEGVPSIKSYASLILLQNELRQSDVENNKDWKIRVLFSRNYLHRVLEREKDLICTYCGKNHLKIEEENMFVPQRIKATIDHVLPVSLGGEIYNEKNLVVACGICNSKKSNMLLKDFLNRFKHLKPNMTILNQFL